MKLDLHIHTGHSFDSKSDVVEILRAAETARLDAIAITDHDTMSACGLARRIPSPVTVIPGMEITSDQGTHIIGLFLPDEIVSRDTFDIIDEIHERGGLVMMPHPFHRGTGFLSHRFQEKIYNGSDLEKMLGSIDLIEAFTYGAEPDDIIDTGRFLAVHPDLAVTSGSDAHRIEDIGKAYVELEDFSSTEPDEIKRALLKSPRLLRYEAYSADKEMSEIRTAHHKGKAGFLKRIAGAALGSMVASIRNRHPRADKAAGGQS